MQFAVGSDVFRGLPRHPDWAYDYLDGHVHLCYRPRPLQLVRDLAPARPRRPGRPGRPVAVRPGVRADRAELVALVAAVWDGLDPYRTQREAPEVDQRFGAGPRFARTLEGADDPWDPGVLVARADDGEGPVVGVVALNAWRPGNDPAVPAEPGLSWLTVAPAWRMAGVATGLLAAAVDVGTRTGARVLHSAASAANVPSVSWHWVNGFHPLAGFP